MHVCVLWGQNCILDSRFGHSLRRFLAGLSRSYSVVFDCVLYAWHNICVEIGWMLILGKLMAAKAGKSRMDSRFQVPLLDFIQIRRVAMVFETRIVVN